MNKPASQPKTLKSEKSEGGILTKVTGALRTWYDLFMGRPRYRKQAGPEVAEMKRQRKAISPEEDSITKDLRNVFGFFGKVFGKATQNIKPSPQKTGKGSPQTAAQIASQGFFVKVVRLFIILVFLMIIVFIGVRIFRVKKIPFYSDLKYIYGKSSFKK